jgi:hypothetical protein
MERQFDINDQSSYDLKLLARQNNVMVFFLEGTKMGNQCNMPHDR